MLPDGTVTVRITEVEAYHGLGTGAVPDPGSHARMGPTPRNAVMWGEPGHLYVYLSHGIHSCVNVVCGPEGVAGGVLLRGAEVIEGRDVAFRRRPAARTERELARGPGRLGDAMGLRYPVHNGVDAIEGPIARLELLGGAARDSSRPDRGWVWRGSPARPRSRGASGYRASRRCRRSASDAGPASSPPSRPSVRPTRRPC